MRRYRTYMYKCTPWLSTIPNRAMEWFVTLQILIEVLLSIPTTSSHTRCYPRCSGRYLGKLLWVLSAIEASGINTGPDLRPMSYHCDTTRYDRGPALTVRYHEYPQSASNPHAHIVSLPQCVTVDLSGPFVSIFIDSGGEHKDSWSLLLPPGSSHSYFRLKVSEAQRHD
jgi:hypothetical protein